MIQLVVLATEAASYAMCHSGTSPANSDVRAFFLTPPPFPPRQYIS